MGSTKTILKRATAYALAFVMAFSMLFTGNNVLTTNAASTVTKLTVKKSKVTIDLSKSSTQTVKVTVKGSNKKFTAKSSKKSVATVKVVKKTVVITGKKKGTAKITVTTKGKNSKNKKLKKTIKVTVKGTAPATTAEPTTQAPTTEAPKPEDKYNSVKITTPTTADGSTPSVNVGTSTKLTAAVDAADADKVVWTSSDPSVAVVSKDGTVTGTGVGTAEITASINGKTIGKIPVSITAVAVTGITLEKSAIELTIGSTASVKEIVAPANATNKKINWTSNKPTIATVSTDGTITAVSQGEAEITATTVDGNKSATVVVTVIKDTSTDVDEIEADVTNSIEGYENTVLAGTMAKVDFKVNGSGAGNSQVVLELENVSGYDYYELLSRTADVSNEGTGSFYIAKKSNLTKEIKPLISDWRQDPAYASYKVTITGGGASKSKTINVSFAQVWNTTYDSYNTIEVQNLYDGTLPQLVRSESTVSTFSSNSADGYAQRYVVGQETTAKDGSAPRAVYYDAVPLLIIPTTVGDNSDSDYTKTLNISQTNYGVYLDENSAEINGNRIKDVPGGLKGLSLEFTKLHLSQYSKIIVRAYESGTMIPLTYQDGLVQFVIDASSKITESGARNIQLGDVFENATADIKNYDILIFIESAGQLSEPDTIGFAVDKIEGKYKNAEVKPYSEVRLIDAVTYSTGAQKVYTVDAVLPNAASYLGKYYTEGHLYMYSMPTFPDTGDAIIKEYTDSTKNEETANYYLYPTTTSGNTSTVLAATSLDDTTGVSRYIIKATSDMIKEIKSPNASKDAKTGLYVVDSTEQGYVHVNARVVVGDKIDYKVSSYVNWTDIKENSAVPTDDFFAIAGQTVTIVATVSDYNHAKKSGLTVNWVGLPETGVTSIETTTDGNSQAKVILSKSAAFNTNNIYVSVEGTGYNFDKLTVGGVDSPNKLAAIHWVQPGLYFKSDVDANDVEYDTSNADEDIVTDSSTYSVGKNYIVGTKVTGYNSLYDVVEIDNIKIGISATSTNGADLHKEDVSNGVVRVSSEKTGNTDLKAGISGLINEADKCIIYTNEDGVIVPHESIGEGTNITGGWKLTVPINWDPEGKKLELIVPNKTFSINNQNESAYVYVKTNDNHGNKISAYVDYKVVDQTSNKTVDQKSEVQTVDGLLPIELVTPDSATRYQISVTFHGEAQINDNVKTVAFTADNDEFTLSTIAPDSATKTIKLTFSKEVDPEIALIKEFYVVTDGNNDLSNNIASIRVDSNSSNIVIITMDDTVSFTNTASVSVKSKVKVGDYDNYYFTDTAGVVLSQNN